MADLIPVTFNEGEPLDVTKLNNLRLNITNTYESVAGLQSATLDEKTVNVIDFGTVQLKTVANKASDAVILPINPSFTGTPMFFVSIGGGSTSGAQITLGVRNAASAPAVYAISTVGNLNITVNYLAIQKKSI